MKKGVKIVGSLLICGILILNGVHVQAMEGKQDNIKYYGKLSSERKTVDAGIVTKDTSYPTIKVNIKYKKGEKTETGVSYASYCFVKADAPKAKEIKKNKIYFTAGSSFNLKTAAD